jgi:hypothetical protein
MVGMAAARRQQDSVRNAGRASCLPADCHAASLPAGRLPGGETINHEEGGNPMNPMVPFL